MNDLTDAQRDIVKEASEELVVTACAGSGKTKTAVHRLVEVRRRLKSKHAEVALLSFSNVAVETFKREYKSLTRKKSHYSYANNIEISTLDSFITTHILRPHAYRTMKCDRTPYLVNGREPFLKSFIVINGQIRRPTTDIKFDVRDKKFEYFYENHNSKIVVNPTQARNALERLAKHGAYTHESANYWVIRTLSDQPKILKALVRRFPYILVDEAQDIGVMHQVILRILRRSGAKISLIGDQAQAIYEFSRADGTYLSSYGEQDGVKNKDLDRNFRSVPEIVEVANKL